MSEEETEKSNLDAARDDAPREDPVRLPPSRQGKKAVTAYVDPETHKQLRLLGVELGLSSQDIIEALEDYFQRHGKAIRRN